MRVKGQLGVSAVRGVYRAQVAVKERLRPVKANERCDTAWRIDFGEMKNTCGKY